MKLRSMLFVPGDSAKKFDKASQGAADALILDLEDAVAPSRKDEARAFTASVIRDEKRGWKCFVRVNPLDTGLTLADLAAIVKPGLEGVVAPKVNSAADLAQISCYLDALEVKAGMAPGTVKLTAVATETPSAMFALGSYAQPPSRLTALTWGAEDLAAAIGARANKDPDGRWSQVFQTARSGCLFAAAAAGVSAIDTLYADFRDEEGLRADCALSRRDGFVGRIAIHPAQVDAINQSFSPSAEEIAHARKIVAAFDAEPDAGTIGIEGRMYDIPHLKAAKRTLEAADA